MSLTDLQQERSERIGFVNPTKKTIQALEKVFAAEIEDRLPYTSRSLVYVRLEKEGLVEEMARTLPGRFAVTVNGWQLTHAGRLFYCSNC